MSSSSSASPMLQAAEADMHICESDSSAIPETSAQFEPQSICLQSTHSGTGASIHRRLATTLNNAGVLFAHLQNSEDALSRYQEALQVRMRLETGAAETSERGVLCARYEEAQREVSELNRMYREHRRTEAPRLDLYPISGLGEQDGPDVSIQPHLEEEERYTPLSPLLIPSSEEALSTEDSNHAALTFFNMGILYHEGDCVDGALKFFDTALDNLIKDRPKDAFLMTIVLNARATIESRRGEYETAMTVLRDALKCHQVLARVPQTKFEGFTANSVITHESVLADKFSLMGRIHYALGNAGEAMDLSVEALQLRRKSKHDDGVSFACSLWNIGLVLALKNDANGAIEHLEEFVRACLREDVTAYPTNPFFRHIASAQHAIALLHLKNFAVKSAVDSLKSALNLRRHALGEDHPAVADSCLKLADVLNQTGGYVEALELCSESLRIRRSVHGRESREVGAVLCLMGSIHQDIGEFDRALTLYEEVLEIARSVVGDETDFVAKILEAIGNLHLYRGQSDEAISSFTSSARIRRRLQQEGVSSDDGDALVKAIEVLLRSYPAAAAA